jgi:hypothetical protein
MLIFVALQRLHCYFTSRCADACACRTAFSHLWFWDPAWKDAGLPWPWPKPPIITKYGTGTGKMIYGI